MSYTTLRFEISNHIARITFSRPEVHNAFHSGVIKEMRQVFAEIAKTSDIRAVVITGEGKSFCAGADLNWMKAVAEYKFDQNLAESNELAELFNDMYTCTCPIIGRINGAAIGGGAGFVAVCDIAIGAQSAVVSFSEVKIGLVPACIGPYVIKKIGEGRSRELFITGERLTADRAKEVGLLNAVVPDADLDKTIDALLQQILTSGPNAISMAKELVSKVPQMNAAEYKPFTAEMIAKLRNSAEGQEGMAAFLAKRKPSWTE
jgi:methylglutaconyl-CoA hydratase